MAAGQRVLLQAGLENFFAVVRGVEGGRGEAVAHFGDTVLGDDDSGQQPW